MPGQAVGGVPGPTLVEEYKDTAKTGRNMDRPNLQKMLAEVPTIRPAYLATWKVDRLGRDLMEIQHRLISGGSAHPLHRGQTRARPPSRSSQSPSSSGDRTEKVRTYARKREFGTSPCSGDGGNRTRVRRCLPKYSPGAVRSALFSAPALTRTSR